MTAARPTAPGFRDLVIEQIDAAHDEAAAHALAGQDDLADWWHWRVHDLQRFLDDESAGPSDLRQV